MSTAESPALTALVAVISRGGTSDTRLNLAPHKAAPLLDWLLGLCAPADGPAGEILARIAALHARLARGETVPFAEWQPLRKETLRIVDNSSGDQQSLGKVAEAAAWPLEGSTSLLADVFGAVATLLQARKTAALGWSEDDQQKTFAHLGEIHAELAATGEPVDRTRIPAIFSVREPELERRFAAQLDAANAVYAALVETTLKRLEGGA